MAKKGQCWEWLDKEPAAALLNSINKNVRLRFLKKKLMWEILIYLLMVLRGFCPRLGGRGISSETKGAILSATDLLCDLVPLHQPVLMFSSYRNTVPLSLTVAVKFINQL